MQQIPTWLIVFWGMGMFLAICAIAQYVSNIDDHLKKIAETLANRRNSN